MAAKPGKKQGMPPAVTLTPQTPTPDVVPNENLKPETRSPEPETGNRKSDPLLPTPYPPPPKRWP